MDTAQLALWLIFGLPVGGAFLLGFYVIWKAFAAGGRRHKLEEMRMKHEHQARMDELNAKIIKMDDLGISPIEFAGLTEEVRRLRQELEEMRQQITSLRG